MGRPSVPERIHSRLDALPLLFVLGPWNDRRTMDTAQCNIWVL